MWCFRDMGPSQNAAQLSYYGLHALQHRGQEGAGIVVTDGTSLRAVKGEGLVNDVFNEEKLREVRRVMRLLHMFVMQQLEAVELKMFNHYFSVRLLVSLAIAHNGNLVNANHLKQHLER